MYLYLQRITKLVMGNFQIRNFLESFENFENFEGLSEFIRSYCPAQLGHPAHHHKQHKHEEKGGYSGNTEAEADRGSLLYY